MRWDEAEIGFVGMILSYRSSLRGGSLRPIEIANRRSNLAMQSKSWIPAYAGMTATLDFTYAGMTIMLKGEANRFALESLIASLLAYVPENYFFVYFAVPLTAQVLPLSTEYSIFQSNVVGVWLNAVIRLSIVIPIILSSPCRTVAPSVRAPV